MKYHNYDSATGRYLSTADADLSEGDLLLDPPVEVWLNPANSTFVEPPEVGENQMAVFHQETQEWVVVTTPTPEIVPPDPLDFDAQRNHILKVIDSQVDAVTRAVIGDRATEYLVAEFEANDYAQRGYEGDVPASVEDQVVATGVTPREAADEILAASAAWRGAQSALRRARLVAKAQVRAAETPEALLEALGDWETNIMAISNQLGL